MAAEKIRFRFRKAGDLRLLSHLDLARSFERMLRRADVPFKSTAGFHPAPRAVFALSMPLGCEGFDEVLELELLEPSEPVAILERLNAQSPNGLRFETAREVPMKVTAMPRRVEYALELPQDRVEATTERAAGLMASEKVWVDRWKPKPRRLNIRPFLRNIRIDENTLVLDLWVTPSGSARADELLKLLAVADLQDAGLSLVRRKIELHDETESPDASDRPPEGNPETLPLNHAPADAGRRDEPLQAEWGLSPNGPVVE